MTGALHCGPVTLSDETASAMRRRPFHVLNVIRSKAVGPLARFRDQFGYKVIVSST